MSKLTEAEFQVMLKQCELFPCNASFEQRLRNLAEAAFNSALGVLEPSKDEALVERVRKAAIENFERTYPRSGFRESCDPDLIAGGNGMVKQTTGYR
jgi:hypothetical protein